MKCSFMCVIWMSLLAQAQVFELNEPMSSMLSSMLTGIQQMFHSFRFQLPGSFKEEQEDNFPESDYGNAIYATMRTTEPFAGSELSKTYKECADRIKVNPELIAKLKRGHWMEEQDLKFWVHCVLVRSGLMTNQSVLRLDVAFKDVTMFEKPDLEANIDKCLPTYAMEPIEISWHFAKCFQQENREKSMF